MSYLLDLLAEPFKTPLRTAFFLPLLLALPLIIERL